MYVKQESAGRRKAQIAFPLAPRPLYTRPESVLPHAPLIHQKKAEEAGRGPMDAGGEA
jgi:hypothetical protein